MITTTIDFEDLSLTFQAKSADEAKEFIDWAETYVPKLRAPVHNAKAAPAKAAEPIQQNTQPIEQNYSEIRDGLAGLAIEFVKAHGRDKFNELAGKYGAKRIGEVKDEDLVSFRDSLILLNAAS